MGISTDGQICYGIAFPEGFSFPWGYEGYDEIEAWWRAVNGYKPPFEIFDKDGEYLGGEQPSNEKFIAYYAAQREFDDAHPVPVEKVNVCSNNCFIYILAIEGKTIRASRGYPEAFNPTDLVVTDEQRNILIEFCKTYEIDIEGKEPHWYLSSYWG